MSKEANRYALELNKSPEKGSYTITVKKVVLPLTSETK